MQSVTSTDQTRIVVLAPTNSSLSYFVVAPQSLRKLSPKNIQNPVSTGQFDQVDQIEVLGLKPTESYELVIIDEAGRLWDRRTFKTLDTKKTRPKIVLASCMHDSLEEPQKVMWKQVSELKPDVILMIGDNVYADWSSDGKKTPVTEAGQLWRRYAETRSKLDIFKTNPLIPVFATWDDHDFGKNDGDRNWELKDAALVVFFAFFDQQKPGPGFERGPGVASWWRAFGVQFALLDDRSFRSPNGADTPDQTHFGAEQEAWLKEGLAAASAPVFLASGDQFFGGYHTFESYEGNHARSFKTELARWRRVSAHPVVFLSGDRHLSEIIKVPKEYLGYPTFEITSSGIHAKVFPGNFERNPNPHQLVGKDGAYNFSLLDIKSATSKSLEMDVTSYGMDKTVFYQKTLTVKRQ
jgi:hypothetical protein